MDSPARAEREFTRSFRIGADRCPGSAWTFRAQPGRRPLETRPEFDSARREQRRPPEVGSIPVGESAAAPEGQPRQVTVFVGPRVVGRAATFLATPLAAAPIGAAFAWRRLAFFAGPWGWWPRLRLENDFPGAQSPTGWQPV